MELHRPKVLILGTFHMSEYEELNSKDRQTEIEELVSNIARFHPSKIAVEMVTEKDVELNNKYHKYKLGTYHLEMNEVFQVGFRLASVLNHEQIFAIDWMDREYSMGYGEVYNWAKENQPELFKEIFEGLSAPELTKGKSVLDYYKEINDPTLLNQLHKMYINMARIGDFDNYIGMNWLNWWYKRNLILYSNITRIIDSQDDRVLFIVGCSHSSIVTKFLDESGTCELVSPNIYL